MEAYILQICTDLEIITFPSDIGNIIPMKRRDPTSNRPPPLLVSFVQQHVRVALLRKKHTLTNIKKYKEVYINPDEPIDIRRNKATFRRVAYKARFDGKSVFFRNTWIQIGNTTYYVSDLDKLPESYQPDTPANARLNVDTDEGTS